VDTIGNISTSNVRKTSAEVSTSLRRISDRDGGLQCGCVMLQIGQIV
jgi:hypothetical protein